MTAPSEYSDVEYVFEPHSRALPNLREYVDALWDRRQFMVALAKSDLRSARARTTLGHVWGVLDPLFQSSIYYFLYVVLRSGASDRAQFLPVLIADFFLYALTTNAIGEGGNSIRRAKSLMLNSTFPRALLPVTTVYKSLRTFVTSACVLAVIFPLVGGKIGPGLFALPLLFALQAVMNVGIALLVSTFVILVPDASNVMTYVTRVLFFATPVLYPVELLPDTARLLIGWQPLYALFANYQAIFSGRMPDTLLMIQTAAWAFALLAIGGRVFLRHEREFTMHL